MKAATSFSPYSQVGQLISIHAAREGGDETGGGFVAIELLISIHAAREGGDPRTSPHQQRLLISIHAAREGGD